MEQAALIPHLFRTESRKIVAVLTRVLGMQYMDAAEDIAAETFLAALETWPYKGIPENPNAWLYTVAKNKALNHISRNQLFTNKIAGQLQQDLQGNTATAIDLSEKNITDSQLQMLFAVCHPAISTEAQIGLALRVLCGFGIDEIATALLSNKETISKRLLRAKEKLRTEKVKIEFPGEAEIGNRLETVLRTLYLLFSEGYYSECSDTVLREDLCLEAMRLTWLLVENETTNLPQVNALLALMCFHASRFAARKNDNGELILYGEQDEAVWDKTLIAKAAWLLNRSSQGNTVSRYHIEAGIAYWHTVKQDSKEKWEHILQLFNHLLQIEYSPIAALNRAYAFSRVKGNEAAIYEAEKLQLTNNHYYFILLGELYKETDTNKARQHFEKALLLAKTTADKTSILKRSGMLRD